MANEIKTRILLKYDSYENWEASEFILKRGEAAVCEMSNTVDTSGDPTILIKYGNGSDKFADLPWTSALAADVYAWAKESGIYIEGGTTTGSTSDGALKVVTGLRWVATDTHPNGALIVDYAYAAKQSDITSALSTYATQTYVDTAEADAIAAAKTYTDEEVQKITTGAGYATTAYVDQVKQATLVAAADDATAKATTAENNAKAYTDGLTLAIEKKDNIDYIVIKNNTGTEIAAANATAFVKDGMLASAIYNTTTNKLVLTWNTDAGIAETEIDLNDLVDTYTGGQGINVATNGAISIDTEVVATVAALEEIQLDAANKDAVVLHEAQNYTNTQIQTLTEGQIKTNTDNINQLAETVEGIVSTGGEANVINAVTVNDIALPITDKTVNIDLTGYRKITDKITSDDIAEEVFIFNCGDALTNIN